MVAPWRGRRADVKFRGGKTAHTKSPSRVVVAAPPLPKRPGVGSTNDAESSVRLRTELLAPPQCQVSESISTASPALSANQHEGGRCATRASVGGSQRSSGKRQTDRHITGRHAKELVVELLVLPGKQRGACVSGQKRVGPIASSSMSCSARKSVTRRGAP